MKKILFIAMHRPDRSPSQRFRFEQYLGYLEQNGFQCDFSFLINAKNDKLFYSSGNYLAKAKIFFGSTITRIKDALKSNSYDIIFIQREAFMLGTTLFENIFSNSKAKVVFDFDDSIWMHQTGESKSGNKAFLFLKDPAKIGKIIKMSDLIFAGNEYLADYARQFNPNVSIVPTTIDTNEYVKVSTPAKKPNAVCIGWSGSFSTIIHFNFVLPALKLIKEKYNGKVYFKVIGDGNYTNESLGIKGLPWQKQTEIEDLSEIDIGLMPLPDDEWTKGKCGLKGLQYMALEISTIMSPVGVNSDIIQDGQNGFLASTTEEWVEKISLLVDNEELRQQMGKNARETVLNQFSVESTKNVYLEELNNLIKA